MDDRNRPRKHYDDFDEFDDRDAYGSRSGGSRTLNVMLILAGGFFLCALLGVGIFVVWAIQNDFGFEWATNVEMPPAETESLQEKQQAVTTAYNSEDVGVDETTFADIQKLFDSMLEACRQRDLNAIVGTVEINRLLTQIKKTGIIKEMRGLEESMLRNLLKQDIDYSQDWTRYVIVHVDPTDSTSEKVVYTFFWDQSEASWPIRWWITKQQGRWKLYDWELLQYGMRESTLRAYFFEYSEDPRLTRYIDTAQEVFAADALMEAGDYRGAARKIRSVNTTSVLPQLADELQLRIAYAWSRCNRYRQLLKASEKIRSPEAVPGAFYGQALSYNYLGHHKKVLQFAESYEAVAGIDPDLLELKAEALQELQRDDEAVACWRRLLKFDPENDQHLQSLGRALDDDEMQVLVEHVRKVEKPVEKAVSLVGSFSVYGDEKAADILVDYVKQTVGDSAQLEFALGQRKSHEPDHEAAAAHFHKAFTLETDEEKKQTYVNWYLDEMSSAGKIVEGYEHAPDPEKAFLNLAYVYEDGELEISREDFRKLVEAHGRNKPDDPWLFYHRAILLTEDRNFQEAEEQLKAGLAAAEKKSGEEEEGDQEDSTASLRYQLVSVLFQDGRGLEAYENIKPADDTFQSLANMYNSGERPEEFKTLIERHRKAFPDDERLDLYDGMRLLKEKNYDEAAKLLARGYGKATDQYLENRYRTNRIEAFLKMGDPLSAYRDSDSPPETFNILSRRLLEEKDWPHLKTLIELHRSGHPDEPKALVQEVEMHWSRKNYETIVDLLSSQPDLDFGEPSNWMLSTLSNWEHSSLEDKLMRSYLRLGRIPEALRYAESQHEETGDILKLIMAHAAAGNPQKVTEYLDEYGRTDRSLSTLYTDEDVGNILRSDRYLSLRRKYPPTLPYNSSRLFILLLLKKPLSPDGDFIRSRIATVSGEEPAIAALPLKSGENPPESFRLQFRGEEFYLTFGSDRYLEEEDFLRLSIKDARLQQAYEDHTGWLAVNVAEIRNWNDDSQLSPAGRLAIPLVDQNTLAIYFATKSKLVANGPEISDVLSADKPAEILEDLGETAWFYRGTAQDEKEQKLLRQVRQRFKEFERALENRKLEQDFFVRVKLRSAFAEESHWIPVNRIERGNYGQVQIFGEFESDSVLQPEFKAGEPVSIRSYEIQDWKYTDGEMTIQARRMQ